MKTITSTTTFRTDVGTTLAYTYTEYDSDGKIVKRNVSGQRILVDKDMQAHALALKEHAQSIIDAESEG